MQKKLHNPKSHSPAIYIPCWLIQVPTKNISNNSKIVYGRLAQWSTETGKVYRSAPQLSEEVGMHVRVIERALKELRDIGLIGTFQPIAGGSNNFEFYDHPWMHEEINSNLIYKSDPPTETSVPPDRLVGTPPTETSVSNIKEIKRNKKEIKDLVVSTKTTMDENLQKDVQIPNPVFFNHFWNMYPIKKGKKVAHDIWKRKKLDKIHLEIFSKLRLQVDEDDEWKRGYAPHPSTYLNQERWKDEISLSKSSLIPKTIASHQVVCVDKTRPSIQEFQEREYFIKNPQFPIPTESISTIEKVNAWIDKQNINANNNQKAPFEPKVRLTGATFS